MYSWVKPSDTAIGITYSKSSLKSRNRWNNKASLSTFLYATSIYYWPTVFIQETVLYPNRSH